MKLETNKFCSPEGWPAEAEGVGVTLGTAGSAGTEGICWWYHLKNHLTATLARFDYFLTFAVLKLIHDTM
jgi:hypothetical protein